MYLQAWDEKMNLWDLYYRVSRHLTGPSFLLDSSMNNPSLGRYSYMGYEPIVLLRSKGRKIELKRAGKWHSWVGDPLDALESLRKQEASLLQKSMHPFSFCGGLVGYLSYDIKYQLEKLERHCIDDLQMYDQYWGWYDSFLVMDHQEQKLWLVSHQEEGIKKMQKELTGLLLQPTQKAGFSMGKIESDFAYEDYLQAIRIVKEHIRIGDIYQANLSQRFRFKVDGSNLALFDKLRKSNPGFFGAFLHFDDADILSISPERYIRIQGRDIETRPIKGTRARGRNSEEDRILAAELQNSIKDRAELLMIVDLERNDLGRICQAGTISVADLFKVTTYATLFHLDAIVRGILREELSIADIIRHTFPGGSITGAPKIMAMKIIEQLEPTCRGIYTGSIGYIDYQGDCDLNIAIRTAIIKDGIGYYQAGGGLVSDSDPKAEYLETLTKTQALFNVFKEAESD